MYVVTGTSTEEVVFGQFMSTMIYGLIFGVILGFIWWTFKRPK